MGIWESFLECWHFSWSFKVYNKVEENYRPRKEPAQSRNNLRSQIPILGCRLQCEIHRVHSGMKWEIKLQKDGRPFLLFCDSFCHYYSEGHRHTVCSQNVSYYCNTTQNPEDDAKRFMHFPLTAPHPIMSPSQRSQVSLLSIASNILSPHSGFLDVGPANIF